MKNQNILLIGFMGSGKTTVGHALAEKRLMNFIDLDAELEKQERKSIVRIFAEEGEGAFRDKESAVLKQFSREKNAVFATGGGVVLREENRALLSNMGIRVWLDVSPQTVFERTRNAKDRPLLKVENPRQYVEQLMETRRPLYAKSEVRVDVEGKRVDQIVNEIESAIEEKKHG